MNVNTIHDFKGILRAAVQKNVPLHAVFDRVVLGEKSGGNEYKFRANRRSALPAVVLDAGCIVSGGSAVSIAALDAELAQLEKLPPEAGMATFPFLLQKYGWRIGVPETDPEGQDIAFCDAFRIEQALATMGGNSGYRLVKGDFSGIQEYIYGDIQQKTAGGLAQLSKRLRGRSILVSLLTDFVANLILRELKLPNWQLLFAGGGHFNLLLPDDPHTMASLKVLTESIDKAMQQSFGDYLQLIIADVACSADAIRNHAGQCFERVSAERDRKKYRLHEKDLHDLFFNPSVEASGRDEREISIGERFPKQRFLLEVIAQPGTLQTRDVVLLASFTPNKEQHALLAAESWEALSDFLVKNKDVLLFVQVLTLNNTNFWPPKGWAPNFDFPLGFGFRFLGKNLPYNEAKGRPMTFEEIAALADEDNKEPQLKRIAAIMLDVDNLGLVFSHGLGEAATLPRIATLSREMNYFFTAHFDHRAREKDVYVVYSGGDDAFAVGKWDKLLLFAKQLQADFQTFTCCNQSRNPNVHFSAGVFQGNPFYPVGRFYRDAKRLQDKAKEGAKNQIDVFDHTLGWESFSAKLDLANDLLKPALLKGITNGGRKFSVAFAYRLLQLVKSSYYERDTMVKGVPQQRGAVNMERFAKNIANMRYLFARNGFNQAEIERLSDELEKKLTVSFLKDAFNFNKKENARDYLVAFNFALFQLRSSKESKQHG